MSGRRLAVAVLAVLSLAIGAVAQKNELAVMVGRTFVSGSDITNAPLPPPFTNNRVNFGRGMTFQANYGRHLRTTDLLGITFEVPFTIIPDTDLNSSNSQLVPKSYRAYFVTPGVRLNLFPATAFSPFASIGGGIGHFTTADQTVFNVIPNPGQRGNTTGVLQFGAGIDVRFFHGLGLRGEVRDLYSGLPNLNVQLHRGRQHNVAIQGGVVFHF